MKTGLTAPQLPSPKHYMTASPSHFSGQYVSGLFLFHHHFTNSPPHVLDVFFYKSVSLVLNFPSVTFSMTIF